MDERRAKKGSDDRNSELIARTLHPWLHRMTFHPMPVDGFSLLWGARRYARLLESRCGSPPVFDLVHLGLGEDGHTASLLPGDPALAVRDEWVAVTRPAKGYRRMTLTYPTLDAARLVVFVVGGTAKSRALRGVMAGDQALPAARLAASNVLILADAAAAALL